MAWWYLASYHLARDQCPRQGAASEGRDTEEKITTTNILAQGRLGPPWPKSQWLFGSSAASLRPRFGALPRCGKAPVLSHGVADHPRLEEGLCLDVFLSLLTRGHRHGRRRRFERIRPEHAGEPAFPTDADEMAARRRARGVRASDVAAAQ